MNHTKEKIPVHESAIAPVYSSSRSVPVRPALLSSAIKGLDAGDCYGASVLFDEMEEKDSHLGAVMQSRIAGVINLPMTITPAGDGDMDRSISRFVERHFFGIRSIRSVMSELLATGLGFGSSLGEIFWQIKNREVGIEKIEVRDNRWLRYDNTQNPSELIDFPRWVTTKTPGGMELDSNRFIHFAPLAGRRHPVRSGLYRGLVWLWLFTNYTVKDYLAFNELFGQPLRVGKYGRNASDEERAALRSAVRSLGSDSAAVIDEDSMIEFIQAQAKGSGQYEPALRYFNAEKSKRVLGATLTVEQGSTGSYAQAKVHGDVRMEIIRSDARKLEESINNQVIKRLVDYNFGSQTSYPRLTIKTDPQSDSVLILENCERLKKLGLSFDESWLRKEIGIPPADSDDETGKRED